MSLSAARLLGPFVTPWSLRSAARELLLGDHLGIYLDEIVRQQTPDGGTVARIERPFDVVCREQPLPRSQELLPLLVVSCPGTFDEVRYRAADGTYTGTLRLELRAITRNADELAGGEAASILALGATALLLHELPRASGFTTRWVGVVATPPAAPDEIREPADNVDQLLHTEGHVLAVSGVLLSDLGGPLPPDLRDPPLEDPAEDPGGLPVVEEIALTTTPFEEIP